MPLAETVSGLGMRPALKVVTHCIIFMTSLLYSLQTLGGVAAGSVSPWPMARLDTSQLKSFNARRKWHVSVGSVCVCVCARARVCVCVCVCVCAN